MNSHYEGFTPADPFTLKDFIKSKLEITTDTPQALDGPVSKSFAMSLDGNVSEVTLSYYKQEVDGHEEHVLGMDVGHIFQSLKLLKVMGVRFYADDLDSSHYVIGVVDGNGEDMYQNSAEGFLNSYPTYLLMDAIRSNKAVNLLSPLEDN